MARIVATGLLALAACVGCASDASRSSAPRAAQTPQLLERDVKLHVRLRYLLALPDGYEDPARRDERWPLLLFLHGVGECGDDLELVKRHGPPKLLERGEKLPCLVVSPQAPQPGWSPFDLHALLDDLSERLRVDETRVYLTGLSMGGFGTWATAIERPDRFAAIVPICGGGDPVAVRRLEDVPVWIFHGRLDPIVPVFKGLEMGFALEAAGGHPRVTIYDDLGHDCWTRAYDDPELWSWMFEQRRPPTSSTR